MSLGIIGGLGPMATVYFMELITDMTKADCDQEHLEMLIYSKPTIPDRTKYIIGISDESPLPAMVDAGITLKKQGVDCVAVPCITAHYFHDELESSIGVKVLHAPKETAKTLFNGGITKVGIMATDGTIQSKILQSPMEELGMEVVLPDEIHQQYVMDIIYKDVKAGKKPDMRKFKMVRDYLRLNGAQVIILGCTELSVVKKNVGIGIGFIDVLDVLSKCAILANGKEVKPEYEILFHEF